MSYRIGRSAVGVDAHVTGGERGLPVLPSDFELMDQYAMAEITSKATDALLVRIYLFFSSL